MKTYKNLLEKSLTPECVAKCALEAAQGKLSRRGVMRTFEDFDKIYDRIVKCARAPDYQPREDSRCVIHDGTNGKVRVIEKPAFAPEQILHHILMEPFKDVVRHGLYEEVYGCLPALMIERNGKTITRKYGVHAAVKRLQKWVQTGKKTYVAELDIHHAYDSVDITALMNMLKSVIKDKQWLILMEKFLRGREGKKCGLVLGHYTSPWLWNFYLKEFDHYAASFAGIKYLRFADNFFLVGRNKRKVHRAVNDIRHYLQERLGLALNHSAQIYRFEYPDRKGKIKGRAVNALGVVIHYNRVTLRKSLLKRIRRKAVRIGRKDRATWYDGASLFSRLAWIRATDTYQYYEKHIKPHVNTREMKRKVRVHSKAIAPMVKERRLKIYDGLAKSARLAERKTT